MTSDSNEPYVSPRLRLNDETIADHDPEGGKAKTFAKTATFIFHGNGFCGGMEPTLLGYDCCAISPEGVAGYTQDPNLCG